jgi:hypothetical protein
MTSRLMIFVTSDDLCHFFVDKVARVRDSTDGEPDPVHCQAPMIALSAISGQLNVMT